jgi:hypothetical protein
MTSALRANGPADEGTLIWLSAQPRGLTVEFTDRAPDRRRALIVRSRELVVSGRRCGDHLLFFTLSYLQLAADVGI